jgi:thiosulfate dehydrogenase [quinone] large subunit
MRTSRVIGRGESATQALGDVRLFNNLFRNVRWSWIWIIPRVYIGWQWLKAGWGKVNNPAWFGGEAGGSMTRFVQGALDKATAARPDVQSWYAWFLQNLVLPYPKAWSHAIAIGEVLVGIGLILGVFAGLAAFFGGFMNMNYLLAGTVSANPHMLAITILLVLAWRTAGWWGLDRWVLPVLAGQRRRSGKEQAPATEPVGGLPSEA